jgi:hypothetical protein
MAIPSVYINLEDDVTKIVERLKHNSASQIVLVCPKRSYIFSDSINLRLLKKQTDLLKKEIFILTMDEKGQLYAREAGFALKFLPKSSGAQNLSDIKIKTKAPAFVNKPEVDTKPEVASQALIKTKAPLESNNSSVGVKSAVVQSQVKEIAEVPEVLVTDTIFPAEDSLQEIVKERAGIGKIIIGGVIVTTLILLGLIFIILPKASVVIYPKSEPVTRDMVVNISPNIKEVDVSKLVMPAVTVNENVSVSSKFQSQGKQQIGNKSEGKIRIFNFTKLPINLKAETTTLTLAGKTYKLESDIVGLKPTTYKNARTKEVNEASLNEPVYIIAALGGEEYNLPAGTRIEISNQVFGSNPQLLYAITETEIVGGTTRYLSTISQQDIDSSKETLKEEAVKQINTKLSESGLTLIENAYNLTVTKFTTDNPVGTQSLNFQSSMEVQISGLAFKVDDLESLINNRIKQTISGNKVLQQSQQDKNVYAIKNLDLVNQTAVLQVHYEGQAVYEINLANIAPQLVNKSLQDVNEILRSKAEIDKVEITLAPSWQKKFPLFASKINVSIFRLPNK